MTGPIPRRCFSVIAAVATFLLLGLATHAGGGKLSGADNPRWGFLVTNLNVFPGTEKLFEPDEKLFWRLRPDLHDVFLGIAEAEEGADRAGAVSKLARALAEAKVQSPVPYHELAEVQVKLGELRDARVSYERALALDPAFVQSHNNLGNVLADMGDTHEAIKHFEKAIELDPLSADAYSNLRRALIDSGKHNEAEQAFRKATQANPMYAEAHLNVGTALCRRGQYEEARKKFEATLVIDPASTRARNNLALALLALGQRQKAAGHLLRVVREDNGELKESARKALELIGINVP